MKLNWKFNIYLIICQLKYARQYKYPPVAKYSQSFKFFYHWIIPSCDEDDHLTFEGRGLVISDKIKRKKWQTGFESNQIFCEWFVVLCLSPKFGRYWSLRNPIAIPCLLDPPGPRVKQAAQWTPIVGAVVYYSKTNELKSLTLAVNGWIWYFGSQITSFWRKNYLPYRETQMNWAILLCF